MGKPSKEVVVGCVVWLSLAAYSASAATGRGHPLAATAADEYLFEGKPLSGWVADLKDRNPDVRQSGALAFRRMGPRGKEAAGALVAALKDEDEAVRCYAADALARIGGPAVPMLVAALKDGKIRPAAVSTLGKIGPAADAAVKPLIDLLRQEAVTKEEHEARSEAPGSLGRIGAAAVGPLLGLLKDKDPDVRGLAAEALAHIGPAAERAVPSLAAALEDEKDYVRYDAVRALGCITAKTGAALPHLIKALHDPSHFDNGVVCMALARLGKVSLPDILVALEDGDPAVRANAAHALGYLGREARTAVKPLIAALKDKKIAVRWAAANALGEIGPTAEPAIAPLGRVLRDGNEDVRKVVASTLTRMGSKAVPVLVAALRDEVADVRLRAAWALAILGPRAKAAVTPLESSSQGRHGSLCRRANVRESLRSGTGMARFAWGPPMRWARSDRGQRLRWRT